MSSEDSQTSDKSNSHSSLSPVIVHFKAVGSAPLLKQSKFRVSKDQSFSALADFLRKQLKYTPREPLFLYINSLFAPSMDETLSNLFDVQSSLFILDLVFCH